MQKLDGRDTYTPRGAAPASCNCDLVLNREETLGVLGSKTFSNNSEEQFTRGQEEHSMLVFVLNKHGKPLMPCKPQRARKLLKTKKAKLVQRTPFTIQLLYGSTGYKQRIALGIDVGYTEVGYSVVTKTKEVYAGELTVRNNIKKLLEKRRIYRRTRRSRKWYREPRFNNRGRQKGWLPPSLQHKLDSHVKLVERLKNIIPITRTTVEVATFDTQKMQNPEISGIEYQQGTLQGYAVREYLLEKWGRNCVYCKKKNIRIEVEHINPKSRGGSDRVSNLTTSCRKCNLKKGNQTAEEFGYPEIQKQARESLKATAFMNIIRRRIVDILECEYTYGYITKHDRIKQGLEKSHVNDAFIIAGGSSQVRVGYVYKAKQVRRQNRSLFKANMLKGGRRKRNTIKEVNGFRRFDKVLFNKKKCFIHGLRSRGNFDIRSIDNEKIGGEVNYKKLRLIEHARGIIQEVEVPIPPTTEALVTIGTV